VWCESCKARGKDEKEPSVLCNACKKKRPKGATTRRQQEEEEKQEENQEEQEESAPPKKRKRRKKRQLPQSSDEYKDTSMERRLSEPDSIMDYHDYLAEFIGFRDGKQYTSPHPFPNSFLSKIKPKEVAQFLAMKAYGKRNPVPEDHPTVGRANSLEY
jgi:hypothetical protein